jgi:hypothetical protein
MVSDKPWGDISEADYASTEAFCQACLINGNDAPNPVDWSKGLCKLPVKEPGGALNRNGVHAAAAALSGARGGVKAHPAEKRSAAKKLMGLYHEMDEMAPDSVRRMAGM